MTKEHLDPNWTKKEQLYNDQCNFVEAFYDFHPEAFRVLNKQTLNAVLFYFGAGKYYSDKNFLKRRLKILTDNPELEKKAVVAMRKVAHELRADEDGKLFGVKLKK